MGFFWDSLIPETDTHNKDDVRGLVFKYKSEPIMLRYIVKFTTCLSNEGFKHVLTAFFAIRHYKSI